ncbi:DUF2905 domain-containing protein [Lacibacter sediminis]|uniref:DUF2905 domain-containing protein n=1 Tax=Lacibacter sediminis TaxID=2760713 RepID=A0A7G5XKM4_9BACT|nr:DUF2905 domain-containing protein [Lacibacter sediminis]QNA46027.1 DUF2905 domain-containing protein [Lacibacter sediminis]
MNSTETGKWIILAGLLIVVIGIIIYFFHDKLGWIGRLPGDIRIERENFRFYFPFTTMLLLSTVVSLLIRFIKRFLL